MSTALRKTKSEESGTSYFGGQVKNLFTSTAEQTPFDKNICESDGLRKRRVCLLKAKNSQNQ